MHTPDMTDNVYHALQLKTKLILKVVERETPITKQPYSRPINVM